MQRTDKLNGEYLCPIADEFREYRRKGETAMGQIGIIHSEIHAISARTQHLSKLDNISEDMRLLAKSATEVKDKLLDGALKTGHVPVSVFLIVIIAVFAMCFGLAVINSERDIKTNINGVGSLESGQSR